MNTVALAPAAANSNAATDADRRLLARMDRIGAIERVFAPMHAASKYRRELGRLLAVGLIRFTTDGQNFEVVR